MFRENQIFSVRPSMIASGMAGQKKLYRTGKGSYFLVSEYEGNETKIQLMDEQQAFGFMDEHTACIDTDTYDRIFGIPEKG